METEKQEAIVQLAEEILTECGKREDFDLQPLFQKTLHLSRLLKNRIFELWSLSELEGYQSEIILKNFQDLSNEELTEYKNLRRTRSFPSDCFEEVVKYQLVQKGELLLTEPDKATLTMPVKELTLSYLVDREYYKNAYSTQAPLSITLLERAFAQMKNRIYNFASETYNQFFLEKAVKNSFEETFSKVNERLKQLCPKAMQGLVSAEKFLKDGSLANCQEECWAVLKNFIAFLEPDLLSKTTKDDDYLKQVEQFFKQYPTKDRYDYLNTDLKLIYQALRNKEELNRNIVERWLIRTYLWISDMLDLIK